jgi:L-fucose mutarotase/ribose pyranase (RbsD/FucU family)
VYIQAHGAFELVHRVSSQSELETIKAILAAESSYFTCLLWIDLVEGGLEAEEVGSLLELLDARFPKAHVLLTADDASNAVADAVQDLQPEDTFVDVEIVEDELAVAGATADSLHAEIRFVAKDADGNARDPLEVFNLTEL